MISLSHDNEYLHQTIQRLADEQIMNLPQDKTISIQNGQATFKKRSPEKIKTEQFNGVMKNQRSYANPNKKLFNVDDEIIKDLNELQSRDKSQKLLIRLEKNIFNALTELGGEMARMKRRQPLDTGLSSYRMGAYQAKLRKQSPNKQTECTLYSHGRICSCKAATLRPKKSEVSYGALHREKHIYTKLQPNVSKSSNDLLPYDHKSPMTKTTPNDSHYRKSMPFGSQNKGQKLKLGQSIGHVLEEKSKRSEITEQSENVSVARPVSVRNAQRGEESYSKHSQNYKRILVQEISDHDDDGSRNSSRSLSPNNHKKSSAKLLSEVTNDFQPYDLLNDSKLNRSEPDDNNLRRTIIEEEATVFRKTSSVVPNQRIVSSIASNRSKPQIMIEHRKSHEFSDQDSVNVSNNRWSTSPNSDNMQELTKVMIQKSAKKSNGDRPAFEKDHYHQEIINDSRKHADREDSLSGKIDLQKEKRVSNVINEASRHNQNGNYQQKSSLIGNSLPNIGQFKQEVPVHHMDNNFDFASPMNNFHSEWLSQQQERSDLNKPENHLKSPYDKDHYKNKPTTSSLYDQYFDEKHMNPLNTKIEDDSRPTKRDFSINYQAEQMKKSELRDSRAQNTNPEIKDSNHRFSNNESKEHNGPDQRRSNLTQNKNSDMDNRHPSRQSNERPTLIKERNCSQKTNPYQGKYDLRKNDPYDSTQRPSQPANQDPSSNIDGLKRDSTLIDKRGSEVSPPQPYMISVTPPNLDHNHENSQFSKFHSIAASDIKIFRDPSKGAYSQNKPQLGLTSNVSLEYDSRLNRFLPDHPRQDIHKVDETNKSRKSSRTNFDPQIDQSEHYKELSYYDRAPANRESMPRLTKDFRDGVRSDILDHNDREGANDFNKDVQKSLNQSFGRNTGFGSFQKETNLSQRLNDNRISELDQIDRRSTGLKFNQKLSDLAQQESYEDKKNGSLINQELSKSGSGTNKSGSQIRQPNQVADQKLSFYNFDGPISDNRLNNEQVESQVNKSATKIIEDTPDHHSDLPGGAMDTNDRKSSTYGLVRNDSKLKQSHGGKESFDLQRKSSNFGIHKFDIQTDLGPVEFRNSKVLNQLEVSEAKNSRDLKLTHFISAQEQVECPKISDVRNSHAKISTQLTNSTLKNDALLDLNYKEPVTITQKNVLLLKSNEGSNKELDFLRQIIDAEKLEVSPRETNVSKMKPGSFSKPNKVVGIIRQNMRSSSKSSYDLSRNDHEKGGSRQGRMTSPTNNDLKSFKNWIGDKLTQNSSSSEYLNLQPKQPPALARNQNNFDPVAKSNPSVSSNKRDISLEKHSTAEINQPQTSISEEISDIITKRSQKESGDENYKAYNNSVESRRYSEHPHNFDNLTKTAISKLDELIKVEEHPFIANELLESQAHIWEPYSLKHNAKLQTSEITIGPSKKFSKLTFNDSGIKELSKDNNVQPLFPRSSQERLKNSLMINEKELTGEILQAQPISLQYGNGLSLPQEQALNVSNNEKKSTQDVCSAKNDPSLFKKSLMKEPKEEEETRLNKFDMQRRSNGSRVEIQPQESNRNIKKTSEMQPPPYTHSIAKASDNDLAQRQSIVRDSVNNVGNSKLKQSIVNAKEKEQPSSTDLFAQKKQTLKLNLSKTENAPFNTSNDLLASSALGNNPNQTVKPFRVNEVIHSRASVTPDVRTFLKDAQLLIQSDQNISKLQSVRVSENKSVLKTSGMYADSQIMHNQMQTIQNSLVEKRNLSSNLSKIHSTNSNVNYGSSDQKLGSSEKLYNEHNDRIISAIKQEMKPVPKTTKEGKKKKDRSENRQKKLEKSKSNKDDSKRDVNQLDRERRYMTTEEREKNSQPALSDNPFSQTLVINSKVPLPSNDFFNSGMHHDNLLDAQRLQTHKNSLDFNNSQHLFQSKDDPKLFSKRTEKNSITQNNRSSLKEVEALASMNSDKINLIRLADSGMTDEIRADSHKLKTMANSIALGGLTTDNQHSSFQRQPLLASTSDKLQNINQILADNPRPDIYHQSKVEQTKPVAKAINQSTHLLDSGMYDNGTYSKLNFRTQMNSLLRELSPDNHLSNMNYSQKQEGIFLDSSFTKKPGIISTSEGNQLKDSEPLPTKQGLRSSQNKIDQDINDYTLHTKKTSLQFSVDPSKKSHEDRFLKREDLIKRLEESEPLDSKNDQTLSQKRKTDLTKSPQPLLDVYQDSRFSKKLSFGIRENPIEELAPQHQVKKEKTTINPFLNSLMDSSQDNSQRTTEIKGYPDSRMSRGNNVVSADLNYPQNQLRLDDSGANNIKWMQERNANQSHDFSKKHGTSLNSLFLID